jgi:hypothetical protein
MARAENTLQTERLFQQNQSNISVMNDFAKESPPVIRETNSIRTSNLVILMNCHGLSANCHFYLAVLELIRLDMAPRALVRKSASHSWCIKYSVTSSVKQTLFVCVCLSVNV